MNSYLKVMQRELGIKNIFCLTTHTDLSLCISIPHEVKRPAFPREEFCCAEKGVGVGLGKMAALALSLKLRLYSSNILKKLKCFGSSAGGDEV